MSSPPDLDLARLESLSPDQAARRLAAESPNKLPASRPRSLMTLALEVIHEPIFLLLVEAGGIYLLLCDLARGHHAAGLRAGGDVYHPLPVTQDRARSGQRGEPAHQP